MEEDVGAGHARSSLRFPKTSVSVIRKADLYCHGSSLMQDYLPHITLSIRADLLQGYHVVHL